MESLHGSLYPEVQHALDAHGDDPSFNEDGWSKGELGKRIVGYMYKGAGVEGLADMSPKEAVDTMIQREAAPQASNRAEMPSCR